MAKIFLSQLVHTLVIVQWLKCGPKGKNKFEKNLDHWKIDWILVVIWKTKIFFIKTSPHPNHNPMT
jgi:hypothetical protein